MLAGRCGAMLGGRVVGLVAGLLVASFGPLVFFEGELLSVGWATFWSALLLLAVLKLRDRPRLEALFLLGATAALAVLTRPELLLGAAFGLAWLAWAWRRATTTVSIILTRMGSSVLGFAAVALPAAAVCLAQTGHFGLLPASGGLNAYIGNNPDWKQTIAARPGEAWTTLATLPEQHGVRGDMWAQQRFYLEEVRRYALNEPRALLEGLIGKSERFLSAREIPRELDLYAFREWSWCLRALVWKVGGMGVPWGVVFPLAVVGALSRRCGSGLLVGYAVACALAVIVVFPASRYRVPLVPAIAPLAALGATEVFAALRGRRVASGVWRLGIAGAVAVAISLPGPFPEERHAYAAEIHRFVGNRFWHEGNLPRAARELALAASRSPDPVVLDELGEVLVGLGRHDEAIARYHESLCLRSDLPETHNLLGVALLTAGRPLDAAAALDQAVALDTLYVEAYSNLGVARLQAGDVHAAVAALSRASRLRPDDPAVRQNLAAARFRAGDSAGAIEAP